MHPWKRLLLPAYYHLGRPLRWQHLRRAMARGRAPIMVLIYHRVDDDEANVWTTSTRDFVRGIHWLKKHFELVSLEEAQQRIRDRRNERPCVSITWDDGYQCNGEVALPLLLKERIPFTYFVTLENILEGKFFGHDTRMGNRFAPNTLDEIKALADAGVEIGAHSRTHANFARMRDTAVMHDELVQAGEELQAAVGKPVRYFAFPFGQPEHLSAEAFHLAYEAGYEAVCSAYGGYNFPGDDAFHLQRIGADGPLLRMKLWTGYDPRKERMTRRFDYMAAAAARPEGVALP